MPEGVEGTEKAGGLIPFFFYDVFARILPGGFLLLSVTLLGLGASDAKVLPERIQEVMKLAPIAGPTVALLVFLMAADFIGFFLGSLSFSVEWLWDKVSPLSVEGLRSWLGAAKDEETSVEAAFMKQFGVRLKGGKGQTSNIVHCSFSCWNFVSLHRPGLAVISARWDAEALLSRSVLFASVPLMFWSLVGSHWLGFFVQAMIFPGAFFSFKYHRCKRVFGRFSLFHLASSAQATSPSL
jgi:hypothetical protein